MIISTVGCGPRRSSNWPRRSTIRCRRTTPSDLGRWFFESADSGSLVRYLETFDHTLAVMQTAANLRRVAREFVADLADDGVIYGETRGPPNSICKPD